MQSLRSYCACRELQEIPAGRQIENRSITVLGRFWRQNTAFSCCKKNHKGTGYYGALVSLDRLLYPFHGVLHQYMCTYLAPNNSGIGPLIDRPSRQLIYLVCRIPTVQSGWPKPERGRYNRMIHSPPHLDRKRKKSLMSTLATVQYSRATKKVLD